jgi:hypothetical protein
LIDQLLYGISGDIRERDGENWKPLSAAEAARTILRAGIVRRSARVVRARITGHKDDDVACLESENAQPAGQQ